MYLLIPYVIVPLALWAYLYTKTKKDASPRILKLINTLGSSLVVMGGMAFILNGWGLNINIMMLLIVLAGAAWAIYFNFFFGKKKTSKSSK